MAVGGTQTEFPHMPWFVPRRLQDLGANGEGTLVELVYIVHYQVGRIAVIPKFPGGRDVGASAEHEFSVAGSTEHPVAWVGLANLAAQNVSIPRSRYVKLMDCQNRMCAPDLHGVIMLAPSCDRVAVWSLATTP